MPERNAKACGAAITAEQGCYASAAAAALGVDVAPELRHRLQRLDQDRIECLGATGMAHGCVQAVGQAVAPGAVGRPGGRFVLVVERCELADQLALAGAALGLSGAWDRLLLGRIRFCRLWFSRFLFTRGLIGDLLQLHLGAKGITAEGQPTERLQIREVLTQQPRLQMPAGGQFPQRQLHPSFGVSPALQVAVEGGHADRPAGIGRAFAALIELLQGAIGFLDRFRARGVEAHGAVQENGLLARHGRLWVSAAKTAETHSTSAFPAGTFLPDVACRAVCWFA